MTTKDTNIVEGFQDWSKAILSIAGFLSTLVNRKANSSLELRLEFFVALAQISTRKALYQTRMELV